MDQRLSRGTLLRVSALAGLGMFGAGCTGLRVPGSRGPDASSGSAPGALTLGAGGMVTAVPGLMSRYGAVQPRVWWVKPSYRNGVSRPEFELWNGMAWESDILTWSGEPLDAALHQRNFDPSILQAGAASSFAWRGHTYALPLTQYPWAVQWRADVFTAAGLPAPASDWTLDDFTAVCSELQVYAKSGKQPAIQTPLGPLGGEKALWVPPNVLLWSPAFGDWGLWTGFALGFGGRPVVGGRFRLTDAGTVQGLGRLVDLARRFAAPPPKFAGPTTAVGLPSVPPLPAGACDVASRPYAMQFTPYVPPLGPLAPPAGCTPVWQWARLPRFPADPVVPTAVVGMGLQDGNAVRPGQAPKPVAQALPYIQATADLILWLYGSEAQALLAATGLPPVLADPQAQARFWSQAASSAKVVGDWAHFQPYTAGWPALPPAKLVGDALTPAVADPAQLPALLAAAEKQMNAWVQQAFYRSGSSATG